MESDSQGSRLNQISTAWTDIRRARDGTTAAAAEARRRLLDRYGKAVRRYLLGALRDAEAADDLAQEFALRFLRGDLCGADPQRGRFRDFVKGVLAHLIADHHRLAVRRPRPLPDGGPEPAAPEADEAEREFLEGWRAELLGGAWKALQSHQAESGQPFYTVLRFRAENPGVRSGPMAEQLAGVLGKPVTADWVRQALHRARERFAELLIDEVAQTLDRPTRADIEQELIDLRLLDHCRPALDRFGSAD